MKIWNAGDTVLATDLNGNFDTMLKWPFGDASDGDVNVNSGSFSSGPISGNALTRDAYFNNLTLSGGDLMTNGYRLFVKGTLTRNSTYKIYWNGNAGSTGNNGGDANPSSGSGTGGTGGGGGGAGSNSGTFFIAAFSIVDSGSGTMFQFKGGNGGTGGNGGSCGGNNTSPNGGSGGGGGGGAGGNGGSGVLMYAKKTGTCTFDQSGGTGGTGGNGGTGSSGGSYPHPAGPNGTGGTAGASGVLYEFNLEA